MCGHDKHHHGECGCHEGRHGGHHEGSDCECHKEPECEHGCHEGRHERGCGCHEGSESAGIHFERRFVTRAERIAQLEAYLKDLQTEAKAVEERIAEMKAVGA